MSVNIQRSFNLLSEIYFIRNPGRYHGGILKYNILGQYRDRSKEEAESSNSLMIVPNKPQSNFKVFNKDAPIIRRNNLSEVTLQCAIVVRIVELIIK